jgi:hypothetical protein
MVVTMMMVVMVMGVMPVNQVRRALNDRGLRPRRHQPKTQD